MSNNVLFDLEHAKEYDDEASERGGFGTDSNWEWTGVCFHPRPQSRQEDGQFEEHSQEWVDLQEKELDKGKGASTTCFNEKMELIAVGCEE